MRRIQRAALSADDLLALSKRQRLVDEQRVVGGLDVAATWRNARRTSLLGRVHASLCRMAGARERCMYCLDSLGTDIEHFWPKSPYPGRMFQWPNLLLGCAECGRRKGARFPLGDDGQPALLDPTQDDPWRHLDFDPQTGIVTARYDRFACAPDPRGLATVELLGFETREALHEGRRRSWKRLAQTIGRVMARADVVAEDLIAELAVDDDFGLLPWCFSSRGGQVEPLRELRVHAPALFDRCARLVGSPSEPGGDRNQLL